MHTGKNIRGRRLSGKRLCAALSMAAVAATTAGLAPATATIGAAGIAPGKNITVFHNIDFVATFGWTIGDALTVEVFRNGVLLGTSTGPAVDDGAGGGALEVNHGPVGAPAAGDCFVGHTPDIRPGDLVRVTGAGTTSEVIVDNITFSGAAFEQNPVRGQNHPIMVKGVAKFANGSPIPVGRLDSAEFRDTSKYRGVPNRVFKDPAVVGGFVLQYNPPYTLDRNEIYPQIAQRKRSLLKSGGHAIGFGHVAVLPPEAMLVDGLTDTPGPALGCEASVAAVDKVNTVNHPVLNHAAFVAGGNLVIGGRAFESSSVNVTVGSLAAGRGGVARTVTPSGGAWSASIPMSQLRNLPEGKVVISMRSTRADGTISGVSKTVVKDRITAPVKPASVRATAGNHSANVSWARSAFNGNSAITGYRVRVLRGGVVARTVKVGTVGKTTVRRLVNGERYRFSVIAVNAVGKSAASPRSNRVVPQR